MADMEKIYDNLIIINLYKIMKFGNNASSEMISTHYELCSKYSHICHESFRIVKIAGLLLRFTASSFQLILMDLLASCVFVISIINNNNKKSAITKHSNLRMYSFFCRFIAKNDWHIKDYCHLV